MCAEMEGPALILIYFVYLWRQLLFNSEKFDLERNKKKLTQTNACSECNIIMYRCSGKHGLTLINFYL